MATTEENNKLIAEFIGTELMFQVVDKSNYMGDSILSEVCGRDSAEGDKAHYDDRYGIECEIVEVSKYHTSWDWLMPVVAEINKIAHEQELYDVGVYEQLTDHLIGAVIDTSYSHVVEFIKWYNENK